MFPDAEFSPALTVLSFGGGQDSTAILHMLLQDHAFRARYAPRDLVVVMSDTGDEHPQTLHHVAAMGRLAADAGVPFFFLTADKGFHRGSWTSLTNFYKTHSTIGSKAFPKTCTDRLKISVIYRWLESYLGEKYDMPGKAKSGVHRFTTLRGRIRVLIGISAEEAARRIAKDETGPAWMKRCIERRYPLVELGMTRADCIAHLRNIGAAVPMPSNCMRCHFASDRDLLWLANEHPEKYAEWVELEQAKLTKHAALGDRNLGVFGRRTLPEVLAAAKVKYADLTSAELNAYKFTHGHCVRSAY